MSASGIYVGQLSHARLTPKPHAFRHRLYMLYLDLDELPTLDSTIFGVERARPLSFRRSDYLGDPVAPLADAVRDEVQRVLGTRPLGPVRLLTQVRALGYVFNPVSFYYCFARGSESLQAVVAEITNTPWGERHRYVLPADGTGAHAEMRKAFHVSPFFSMEQDYAWRFSTPGTRLDVDMASQEQGRAVFHARLSLERRPMTTAELARVALLLPVMSLRIHAAIYGHALALWLKRTPVFGHPRTAKELR